MRIALETKTTHHAGRQPDSSLGVHAQCTLHGEQSGRSASVAGQRSGQIAEHLVNPNLVARPSRPTLAAPRHFAVRRLHGRGRDGLRHHSGLFSHGGTGRTRIGKSPQAATPLAGEKKANGPRTAAVAWVPAAASLMTLADPCVRRQCVTPGMFHQMLEYRCARRGRFEHRARMAALLTNHLRPVGTRSQFYCPDTLCRGVRRTESHETRAPPHRSRAVVLFCGSDGRTR